MSHSTNYEFKSKTNLVVYITPEIETGEKQAEVFWTLTLWINDAGLELFDISVKSVVCNYEQIVETRRESVQKIFLSTDIIIIRKEGIMECLYPSLVEVYTELYPCDKAVCKIIF